MDLIESLQESAPLAWRLAPRLCYRDPARGEDCSWVHGLWQHLSLMGLVGSLDRHAAFYRQALEAVAGAGAAPRVLVFGSSDYSMFALVLDAFRARGVEPDITVVDRCETPLMLHRWYAERVAGKVDARRCDMLEFSAPQAFDVVCSHASYGPFPPGQRATLFARWHDLLRPGGRIITVINRARPDSTAEPVTFTPAERAAFHAAVLQAAGKLPASLATDPAELARRADTYASRHSTYPVRSAEEIREMLERSGFRIEHAPSATAAPGSGEGLTAPSTRGGAGHTGIVATRL